MNLAHAGLVLAASVIICYACLSASEEFRVGWKQDVMIFLALFWMVVAVGSIVAIFIGLWVLTS